MTEDREKYKDLKKNFDKFLEKKQLKKEHLTKVSKEALDVQDKESIIQIRQLARTFH
jgi:lysozyme family protein